MDTTSSLQGTDHDRNFVTLVDEKFGQKCGVKLFDIPHDPIFPTSGILIADGEKKIWISTDVENITEEMKKVMSKSNLVVFDSTFFDGSVFPASKLHHMTVERSLPILRKLNTRVVFSHINHSENWQRVEELVNKAGCKLACDGMMLSV